MTARVWTLTVLLAAVLPGAAMAQAAGVVPAHPVQAAAKPDDDDEDDKSKAVAPETPPVGGALALALAPAAQATVGGPTDDAPPPGPSARVAAPAHEEPDFQYEIEAQVASDYVFRGIDQNNHRLAGLLDASVSYKSFYAGFSTANIDYRPFGDHRTNQELDGYLGYKDEAFGFVYDVGLISYNYINQPGGLNYSEGYVRGSREIGPFKVGLEFYFDPGVARARRGDIYGEGQVAYRFARKWTLSVAVGHGSGDANYLNYNAGVAYALTRNLSVDVRYSDTEAHDLGPAYDGRVIASLKLRIP